MEYWKRSDLAFGVLLAALLAAGLLFSLPENQRPRINASPGVAQSVGAEHKPDHAPTGNDKLAPEQKQNEEHGNAWELYGVKPGEFLLFLATVGLWYATARLVREARESAVADRRPWLAIEDFKFSVPLTFTDGGAVANFDFMIKNVGSSPAMKTTALVAIQAQGKSGSLLEPRDAFIKQVLARDSYVIFETVFPGVSVPRSLPASILQDEIDRNVVKTSSGASVLSFMILAGVYYESTEGTSFYTVSQYWPQGRAVEESSNRADLAIRPMGTYAI